LTLDRVGTVDLKNECIFDGIVDGGATATATTATTPQVSRLDKINDQLENLRNVLGHGTPFEDKSNPLLLWHATSDENAITSIMETGFLMKKLGSGSGDSGYIGCGIYFTNCPSYGQQYLKNGCNKLILSWVLLGKPYVVVQRKDGRPLENGYHSHYAFVKSYQPIASGTQHDGDEFCIFDENQILPSFVVEFSNN